MTAYGPLRQLSILTAVVPGTDESLAQALTRLQTGDDSPFRRIPRVHFARWVVTGQLTSAFDGAPVSAKPLQMRYLLFGSAFNGTTAELFHDIRMQMGPEADSVWANCVGYPGYRRGVAFHRYLQHNCLPIHQDFAAYEADVPRIAAVLALRADHRKLAERTQRASAAELRAAFRAAFGAPAP